MNIPATDIPTLLTGSVNSPLGDLRVVFSSLSDQPHIHSVDYMTGCTSPTAPILTDLPKSWLQSFFSYFSGDLVALDELPISLLVGTDFQRQVWLALRQIPAGSTWSYKTIATHIGRPKAVRAVGQALSKNPLPIILPCHRVIKSSGKLGGYAGSSDLGNMRKRYLLWHEGQLEAEPQDLF